MRVAVITPCLYPDDQKIRLLVDSVWKYGITLRAYGIGSAFFDWKRMFLEHTLPTMERLQVDEHYTHVLYVDGIDSIFMSGLNEIIAKYERLGSPNILMSADADQPAFNTPAFNGKRPWRFLNAGGFLADIELFVFRARWLADKYGADGDYQNWFVKDPRYIVLDNDCSIFQSMNGEPYLLPRCKRVLNAVTGTWPSVLHFRGGYCDPETGRESRILPFLKEIEQS